MKQEKEWFVDDDFWKTYAPIIFDDKHWDEVPAVADGVIELGAKTGIAGKKVLDLCCGMGRISTELARRGFDVTGVDLSPSFLETAREDALYEKLDVEYVQEDIRTFVRPVFYDIAVNLYVSFGYCEKKEDDLLSLCKAYESIKPGGCFIVEPLSKEIAVRDFTEGEWFERAGHIVLTEFEPVDSWAALKNRWILIRSEDYFRVEKTFVQRLYSGTEMRDLLLQAGFEKVEIYGGWDKKPYDQYAETLIAVGRKKE